jgi:branched-chain amino acid aminotransferase
MTDCIGKYYYEGASFRKIPFPSAPEFFSGTCFYEVLRVTEGCCIFLDDHLVRLNESLRLSGISFRLARDQVSAVIQVLIRRNGLVSGNIRLMVHVKTPEPPELYSCCIPFYYPLAEQYKQGVSTAVYHTLRSNPNVKQLNPMYQKEMLSFMAERNIYESLLADEHDRITEGSRSNVFFIRHNTLFTAPDNAVLKGITRNKVILLCKVLNYKLIKNAISIEDLNSTEALFLTGTSPKILPVCRIDNRVFMVDHPLVKSLMESYDQLIRTEIARNRNS